jgi:hypothetical protein
VASGVVVGEKEESLGEGHHDYGQDEDEVTQLLCDFLEHTNVVVCGLEDSEEVEETIPEEE